jgi:bilin biosynthesis protein
MADLPIPTVDPAVSDALIEQVMAQQATVDPTFNPTTLAQLVEAMGDTRGMTRLRIATMLSEIGAPATPFLLAALANHPNVVVRRASAKTLTLIADPNTVPQMLQALLTDPDTVVKGSSVGAMARIGAPAVGPLLEILGNADRPEEMKGHAAWALAFIGAEAKELLYPAIHSDSPAVRGAVVGAIAKVAQEEPKADLFDLLVNALADPDGNVRCEAAAALGNLAYQPAQPELIAMLEHTESETRKAGALALMKLGDASAIALLQSHLTRESDASLHPVLKLAISQLEKRLEQQSNNDDWD